MYNFLKKSLSGEKRGEDDNNTGANSVNGDAVADAGNVPIDASATSPPENVLKGKKNSCKGKRSRSGASVSEAPTSSQKRTRLVKTKHVGASHEEGELLDSELETDSENEDGINDTSSNSSTLDVVTNLPPETPQWGVILLNIIQNQINKVSTVEAKAKQNAKDIKKMERKVEEVESRNKILKEENVNLKEKLLEVEARQRRNNLLFDGINDAMGESDLEIIAKVRNCLKSIGELDVNFRIDKCHRIDGPFDVNKNRRILCTFNWYYDVQVILRHRKSMPRGVFVSEDLPEEWVDRRRILKPIYNAAKRKDNLKSKTYMTKDKLVIDGKTISAGPVPNIEDANAFVDVGTTCERSDSE